MKEIILLLLISIAQCGLTQNKVDFEEFSIDDDSYIKDAGTDGGFYSKGIFLPNQYTDAGTFDFWSGWVISNRKDTITMGFTNEASSWAGKGNQGTENFSVCYASFPTLLKFDSGLGHVRPSSFYISNSTYTALSMKNGDGVGKQFGGIDGNDPDSLVLSIKAWKGGSLSTDSIKVFLADYRFEDNSLDYILKDWLKVDLTGLGIVDSLQFEMFSSDIGVFGINTPTYFCMDDFEYELLNSNEDLLSIKEDLLLYPNPTVDLINLKNTSETNYWIYDLNGKMVIRGTAQVKATIDVSRLEKGQYFILTDQTKKPLKFVKI